MGEHSRRGGGARHLPVGAVFTADFGAWVRAR